MEVTSSIADTTGTEPLVLQTRPAFDMSDEEFFAFCQLNRDLRIERTSEGEIVIMSPAGAESGNRNLALAAFVYIWARRDSSGVGFDSSTGFILPNGATRAPDVSWVQKSRLADFSSKEKKRFLKITPDFVIEIRSHSDRLSDLVSKMQEYAENGVRLGWLIDPLARQVYVYRPGRSPEQLLNPDSLSGEPELPGFHIDLKEIWEPPF